MIRTCDETTPAFISHELDIPQCCPVSGNPYPGSKIRVSYFPAGIVVPVEDLASWLDEYIGGHESRSVRNMEEMIQDLAVRCTETTRASVRVSADLKIKPPYGGEMQRMRVTARATPTEKIL
jgi:NADPH-dependent 7-cyano-7-deazaguanine reductase QueF